MIYLVCVGCFLFGYFVCALFTVGKRADENYFAEKGCDDAKEELNDGTSEKM